MENIVLNVIILFLIVGLYVYIYKQSDKSKSLLGDSSNCLPDGSIGMYCDFDVADVNKRCIMNPNGSKCCGDSHTQAKGANEMEWLCGAK